MRLLTGWLILLLSIAGHTELWVLAVNRSHALPFRPHRLRRFRTVHDVAILSYPLWLVLAAGTNSESLLRGGTWEQQPEWLQVILTVTMAGCVPLLFGILRWQLFRAKQFHTRDSVRRVSMTELYGESVRGEPRTLTRIWPWNEFCDLEVNTKRVPLSPQRSRPGAGSDPLRILHFSDAHVIGCPGNDYYREVVSQALREPVDLIAFTGDLIDDPALLTSAVEILSPLTGHAPCVFILGNHDWRFDFSAIRKELEESGWRCVSDRPMHIILRGHHVLIAGSEMPWMGEHPPIVQESGCDLNLLLSHSPDQFRLARRLGFDLMLSGHTHGGQVVLPVIGPVYSPSLFGVSFAAGLFRLGRLTLHVSRGIGAKDPLRWRCHPELTLLEVSIG